MGYLAMLSGEVRGQGGFPVQGYVRCQMPSRKKVQRGSTRQMFTRTTIVCGCSWTGGISFSGMTWDVLSVVKGQGDFPVCQMLYATCYLGIRNNTCIYMQGAWYV